jgi:hypothetical protein
MSLSLSLFPTPRWSPGTLLHHIWCCLNYLALRKVLSCLNTYLDRILFKVFAGQLKPLLEKWWYQYESKHNSTDPGTSVSGKGNHLYVKYINDLRKYTKEGMGRENMIKVHYIRF